MISRNGEDPTAEKSVLRKLKPGPGLSRQEVSLDQKARLRIALSDLAAEHGYDSITVRALIRRANISTSTFYIHYESVEDCLASLVASTIRGVTVDIRQGHKIGGDAITGLRTALCLLMERLAQEPRIAQTVFIESAAAGPRVRESLDGALDELETLLVRTLAAAPRPAAGTTQLAVGLLAGVFGVIRRTTLAARVDELPGLADELTDWMLSVAHEEVVTFFGQRSRLKGGSVGERLPRLGVAPATRESAADALDRAVTTTARLAATEGFAALTSARIRKDAGLSRHEFDQHFASVEDCYLAAVERVAWSASTAAQLYAAEASSWEGWICKVVAATCSFIVADPDLARLVLVGITAPGNRGLIRREQFIGRVAAHVRAGAPVERRPSELAAVASICAIWRIAEREVAARRTSQLSRVAPVFVYIILAARRTPDKSRRKPAEAGFGTKDTLTSSCVSAG
jgi:AcrR family transcriptional regulator